MPISTFAYDSRRLSACREANLHSHHSKLIRTLTGVSSQYKLAESGLWVPACASLLSGMEASPSQGVEVLVLADQDLEDMFLVDSGHLGQAGQRDAQRARLCCFSLSTIYHLILRPIKNMVWNGVKCLKCILNTPFEILKNFFWNPSLNNCFV